MDGHDSVETGKVLCVEGENMRYSVNPHGRNQPCIMHLNAADLMLGQQMSPDWVNGGTVSKQSASSLNLIGSTCRFDNRVAEAILVDRGS